MNILLWDLQNLVLESFDSISSKLYGKDQNSIVNIKVLQTVNNKVVLSLFLLFHKIVKPKRPSPLSKQTLNPKQVDILLGKQINMYNTWIRWSNNAQFTQWHTP